MTMIRVMSRRNQLTVELHHFASRTESRCQTEPRDAQSAAMGAESDEREEGDEEEEEEGQLTVDGELGFMVRLCVQ